MGGRGVDLSIPENRKFEHYGQPFEMKLGGKTVTVHDIRAKEGGSQSPLVSYKAEVYRLRNRQGEVSHLILHGEPVKENGIEFRDRTVAYEWDKRSSRSDTPANTVHKHIWTKGQKDPEHRALTHRESLELKQGAGFPAHVQFKVEDGNGGYVFLK